MPSRTKCGANIRNIAFRNRGLRLRFWARSISLSHSLFIQIHTKIKLPKCSNVQMCDRCETCYGYRKFHLSNSSPSASESSFFRHCVRSSVFNPFLVPFQNTGANHRKNNCDIGFAPFRGFGRSGFLLESILYADSFELLLSVFVLNLE